MRSRLTPLFFSALFEDEIQHDVTARRVAADVTNR
jgi:hypothetical protein